MIKCQVWWFDEGGSEVPSVDVELPVLPRKGDVLDLEHLEDEAFELAFEGREVAGVNRLLVREVVIGAVVRVQTSCPGELLCPFCGESLE